MVDLLFIILFIMMLNQKTGIKTTIPKDHLFKGAIITGLNDGLILQIDPITRVEKLYIPQSNNLGLLSKPCKEISICQNLKGYDDLKIIYPDSLYNDITSISFTAIVTRKICSTLSFTINMEGKIERDRLKEDNPCLLNLNQNELLFGE
jgi:hypothetical protein